MVYTYFMFILKVCESLSNAKIKYAIVGGYAVALHGVVRGTVDVDLLIEWQIDQLIAFEQCMNELGLISKLPIDAEQLYHFKDDYIKNRNLLAWNFYHPKDMTQQVDLIINHDLGANKITEKWVGNQVINILNKNDLIIMKQQAGRPQDIEDIKSLKQL